MSGAQNTFTRCITYRKTARDIKTLMKIICEDKEPGKSISVVSNDSLSILDSLFSL